MQTTSELVFAQYAATANQSATPRAPAQVESRDTLEDARGTRQARSHRLRTAQIHLVLGPVGAGKSTFARGLAADHDAVRLTLDEWMLALFSPDRPGQGVMEWYVERTARCVELMWSLTVEMLDRKTSVVLEIGLLTRREREAFYERVDHEGATLTIHVVDASRDVRRRRVEERNRNKGATFSMVVPPAIFELASDLWEPPDASECDGRDVRFIRTD